MHYTLKTSALSAALCALCAFALAAPSAKGKGTWEETPRSRMETRDRNPKGVSGDFWWAKRFLDKRDEVHALKGRNVDLVMIGDSITHFWEEHDAKGWREFTKGMTALNLGFSGDGTQHVIWRINQGELDGYTARVVTLMIGTNNNSSDRTNPANVAGAVEKIVGLIREKQPGAKIVLHAIFPRGRSAASRHAAPRGRNDRTNELLKAFAEKDGNIVWLDLAEKLTDETGWVPRKVSHDEVHPSSEGYRIWAEALAGFLK